MSVEFNDLAKGILKTAIFLKTGNSSSLLEAGLQAGARTVRDKFQESPAAKEKPVSKANTGQTVDQAA